MAILALQAVSQGLRLGAARTDVLKDIDLAVEDGEFVAIVGFSGTGKTTLINLIAGLHRARQRRACCSRARPSPSPAPSAAWCSRATR